MLVILSGVAGAGKDTIKRELIKRTSNIVTIPSYTDRNIRPGDVEGETYNFITTEEFEKMIENDELYEYNVHHNHYYGTSKKVFNDKIKEGKIIVKDIDVNGTENLVNILKNDMKVVTIFLRVPKEELRRRLETRVPDSISFMPLLLWERSSPLLLQSSRRAISGVSPHGFLPLPCSPHLFL